MSSYQTVPVEDEQEEVYHIETEKKAQRTVLATVMLAICIVTFVLQTELAQYVQKTTSYSKPYFILYISHSCYILMIPLQLISEYIQLKQKQGLKQNISRVIHKSKQSFWDSLEELQYRIQGNNDKVVQFMIKTCLWLSVLLTLPAYIWYLSVNLTSMSNLTAIYNTGCFFAYLFSILMLHDSIVPFKVVAVMLCMLGVLTMAYWSSDGPLQDDDNDDNSRSWLGIFVSCIGASLYGFYEVFYKKYASPSEPTILFANTITGLIGLVTFFILWVPIPVLHIMGIEQFAWPDTTTFWYILAIALMSVIYNATFMAVIALINPVFAAVGVMLTVPAVAITDVLITGVMVPSSTIIGSIFILAGFYILNKQV